MRTNQSSGFDLKASRSKQASERAIDGLREAMWQGYISSNMPAHDWTRVTAGTFHAFHLAWIAEIQRSLNGGLLPEGYYALAEQVAGEIFPDVLMLQQSGDGKEASGHRESFGGGGSAAVLAVAQSPSRVSVT